MNSVFLGPLELHFYTHEGKSYALAIILEGKGVAIAKKIECEYKEMTAFAEEVISAVSDIGGDIAKEKEKKS